ncbi:unnamed protein product [Brassica rapa subsp. trilocularis]
MISELGKRPMLRDSSFGDDYEKEIGALLGEQRRRQEEADELKKELNLYRSGSVLWTVPLAPLPEGFSAAEVGLVEAIKEMGLVVMMRSLGNFCSFCPGPR